MCNLQDILLQLQRPKTFPAALPLIHVSKLGFKQIVSDLSLSPNYCDTFQQHLLYFSYGSAFYEPREQKKELIKLPICFLFNPKALSKINYYYPYDTGAAEDDKYGRHSEHLRHNLDKYRVDSDRNEKIEYSRQLVYHIYETNNNYRIGEIRDRIEDLLYTSFPELFEFLKDRTIEGCDQRQHTIECQSKQTINLKDYLEWIAFPDRYDDLFSQLFNKMQPSPPIRYRYEYIANRPISQIIGEIQVTAQKYINSRYLEIN